MVQFLRSHMAEIPQSLKTEYSTVYGEPFDLIEQKMSPERCSELAIYLSEVTGKCRVEHDDETCDVPMCELFASELRYRRVSTN